MSAAIRSQCQRSTVSRRTSRRRWFSTVSGIRATRHVRSPGVNAPDRRAPAVAGPWPSATAAAESDSVGHAEVDRPQQHIGHLRAASKEITADVRPLNRRVARIMAGPRCDRADQVSAPTRYDERAGGWKHRLGGACQPGKCVHPLPFPSVRVSKVHE